MMMVFGASEVSEDAWLDEDSLERSAGSEPEGSTIDSSEAEGGFEGVPLKAQPFNAIARDKMYMHSVRFLMVYCTSPRYSPTISTAWVSSHTASANGVSLPVVLIGPDEFWNRRKAIRRFGGKAESQGIQPCLSLLGILSVDIRRENRSA